MKLAPQLPSPEIGAYFGLWFGSVLYAIYNLYLLCAEIKSHQQNFDYFETGWSILQRTKDVSDYEWRLALLNLQYMFPWICIHFGGSELLRLLHLFKVIPFWYCIISMIFSLWTFGSRSTLLLIIQPCICVVLILVGSKRTIWYLSVGLIIVLNVMRFPGHPLHASFGIDEDKYYMLMITVSWMTLKCISCSLDTLTMLTERNESLDVDDLVHILAYTMYLPTMMFGPLELYSKFQRSFLIFTDLELLHKRVSRLVVHVLRYTGWLLFTEFTLHFVYITAMQSHLDIVSKSYWAVYGLGYCMGQFFHLKYVVIYGLTTSIMRAENISAPPTPKCIGRIHLYSYMWKYFDFGLYTFLVRYIYAPCCGAQGKLGNKLLASFLCFSFIFVWHGMQMFIFVWTFLNYTGVVVESVSTWISQTEYFSRNMKKCVTPTTLRRIIALISAPLMITSAISNFYFFGGMEIGNFYIQKIFDGGLFTNSCLLFFVYTLCQVSIEIKNWQDNRQVAGNKEKAARKEICM